MYFFLIRLDLKQLLNIINDSIKIQIISEIIVISKIFFVAIIKFAKRNVNNS